MLWNSTIYGQKSQFSRQKNYKNHKQYSDCKSTAEENHNYMQMQINYWLLMLQIERGLGQDMNDLHLKPSDAMDHSKWG